MLHQPLPVGIGYNKKMCTCSTWSMASTSSADVGVYHDKHVVVMRQVVKLLLLLLITMTIMTNEVMVQTRNGNETNDASVLPLINDFIRVYVVDFLVRLFYRFLVHHYNSKRYCSTVSYLRTFKFSVTTNHGFIFHTDIWITSLSYCYFSLCILYFVFLLYNRCFSMQL